jgi:glycosyltransferase involved in cell wall biosynthesis
MVSLPLVSVVVPCRNEEKYIGKCLDSIIANDYPKDRLEVLVVDGLSEDGTKKIVEKYTEQYPFVRLLENRKQITPIAFNIGIKDAKGDLIMIMSAHATCKNDYIPKCVQYSNEYGADNVGGIWKIIPRDNSLIGKAIVFASSHPFGVGNAYYRLSDSKEPRWVDAVAYGCYKNGVFKKIGFFNENLVRGQDMEFNLRLKKTGGKILLVPDAVVYYYVRSDLESFCKHNLKNGIWAILPFKFITHMPVSWRHLVPLVFVSSLISSGILAFFSVYFSLFLLFIFISYFLTNFYFSTEIALKERDWRFLFLTPVIFALLHIGYGLGSLWGLLRVITSKEFWGNQFKGFIDYLNP